MRQTVRLVVLAVAVCAVLATCTLAFLYVRYSREAVPAPQNKPLDVVYTLGVWEGNLAVFEGDGEFPVQLYDVSIASLPTEEQQRLKTGITVQSNGELQALLEDYTS